MKVKIADIKKMIREEVARGIPSFSARNQAEEVTDIIKRHLIHHINMTTTDVPQRTRKYAMASVAMKELSEEIKDQIEKKILEFLNKL